MSFFFYERLKNGIREFGDIGVNFRVGLLVVDLVAKAGVNLHFYVVMPACFQFVEYFFHAFSVVAYGIVRAGDQEHRQIGRNFIVPIG